MSVRRRLLNLHHSQPRSADLLLGRVRPAEVYPAIQAGSQLREELPPANQARLERLSQYQLN